MCQLDAPHFPHSVAVASPSGLSIGMIDKVQSLHIETIPLHETPRRIVHSATHNVYIVITITAASNGVEKSFIRMFDDHTFDGALEEG
mgnify:CR=1 FL=1